MKKNEKPSEKPSEKPRHECAGRMCAKYHRCPDKAPKENWSEGWFLIS